MLIIRDEVQEFVIHGNNQQTIEAVLQEVEDIEGYENVEKSSK